MVKITDIFEWFKGLTMPAKITVVYSYASEEEKNVLDTITTLIGFPNCMKLSYSVRKSMS